jgi:hypothetical protein
MARFDSFDDWASEVRRLVREAMRLIEDPEGDMAAALFVETEFGGDVVSLDHALAHIGPGKTLGFISWLIPGLVSQGATYLGVLLQAWRIDNPGTTDPEDDPDRREVLSLVLGERGRVELWLAPVLRDGEQHPILGQWEREDDPYEGPLVVALKGAWS